MQELKQKFSKIAGDWNGEDDTFTSEGVKYTEFQARHAQDIVDLIEGIETQMAAKETIDKDILSDQYKLDLLVAQFNF